MAGVGRRNLLAMVAILCAVAAVVGVGLRLTTSTDTKVGGEVILQGETIIHAINSPTILRNPTDADNLVATYRVDRPVFSAHLEWSADGGASFNKVGLPLPPGTTPCSATEADRPCPFAPDIAFGPDGTLYVLYVNLQGRGNVPDNLWLSRSTDGGRTLAEPVRVAGELTFQPRIAVAPDGTVHLTWLQAREVGLLRLAGPPSPIVSAHSTDGGETFSEPVVISDTSRVRVGAASPVVDGDGVLSVLYQDFRDDRRNFENLEGPVYEETYALVVTRSSDGGRSFSPGVELESGVVPTRRFLVFLPESPSIAAGPDGSLGVVWAGGRNGDEDVFYKRSSDGGQTWSPAVRVNDNPVGDGTDQYLPRIAVAGSGRIDVIFYDRREDPRNIAQRVSLASSDDDGQTWNNRALSTVAFDSRVGPSASIDHGTDFGTRLGLDTSTGRLAAAWTDTREGSEADAAQDVATISVRLAEPMAFLGRLPVIVVLFLVGAAALLVALRSPVQPRSSSSSSTGAEEGP